MPPTAPFLHRRNPHHHPPPGPPPTPPPNHQPHTLKEDFLFSIPPRLAGYAVMRRASLSQPALHPSHLRSPTLANQRQAGGISDAALVQRDYSALPVLSAA
ncbi:hypothetical protein BU26DRAFT_515636 [Trematosphaeria pertusa]|uniref:Uncharacterized protein n=1 Tax=Trematosphaeria pertusa TaxID=390896 RepID=A0A6A6IUJ4_9PLEO|nr:uncharacterized protein BU26DRAFT_515636 [Trematosphaeria pertusa]KAF2253270.1 hypothetical protein BU26DRAFT_515636 [Trematosphaeria pertusa]